MNTIKINPLNYKTAKREIDARYPGQVAIHWGITWCELASRDLNTLMILKLKYA